MSSGPAADERTLSVGIVGVGDIVRAVHLPVLTHLEGAEIAWLSDLDGALARRRSREYRVPDVPLPADPRRLPDADVVLLTAPQGLREAYYEALSARGIAVYAEKPVARTVEEHEHLCTVFPDHALASGLMMRAWAVNRMARRLIRSRAFGSLRRMRFGFGSPGLVTQGRFYLQAQKGGAGLVLELGIHGIDSLLFLADARSFDVLDASSIHDPDGLELHSTAEVHLRAPTEGSVEAEIVVSALADTIEGIELVFEHASVSYSLIGQGYTLHGEDPDLSLSVRPHRDGRSYRLEPQQTEVWPITKFQTFGEYWRAFLAGVRREQANWTSARAALPTTQLIEAIAAAARRTSS